MNVDEYNAVPTAAHTDGIDIATRRVWHSCCLRIDQDMCIFLCTMGAIFAIMGFCGYQLITLRDCHSQNMYVAILSSLIGVLLPSPVLKK